MSQIENGNPERENNLNIDNVVSSHSELGPTPPDGGYGWMVLFGALVVQVTVPSILSAYGVIILYLNLLEEYEENQVFRIWDKNIILVPILMTVFWLLLEPWSRTIVLISNRPRVVSISGVLLMGAGIMLSNFSAESDENDGMINVFSGMLIGIGASLTSQQAEILLKHYFRKKIEIVQKIYKTSIIFGNVLIPLIIGILCSHFGASLTLVIYAALIIQQCLILMIFSRPTYVVQAIKKNYKILKEASEDEDEEIYPSQVAVTSQNNNLSEDASNNKKPENDANQNNVEDDQDQDENVIGTFNNANTTREIIQTDSPELARYEPNNNPFGSNFVSEWDRIDRFTEPQDLYRETTIATDTVNNIFAYEPPTDGTLRRTANTKKNLMIFVSVLKDRKFYAFTHILLTLKFSSLVFGVLFPAFVSQQAPNMDMMTVIAVVTVMYIGAMCLTIVASFFTTIVSERSYIRFFSVIAMAAFIVVCRTSSQNWRVFFGMLVIFSINSIYITLKPIYNNMSMDFDTSAISIASNCISALLILFVTLLHNYEYSTCFIIAASLHLITPVMCFFL